MPDMLIGAHEYGRLFSATAPTMGVSPLLAGAVWSPKQNDEIAAEG